MRDGPVLPLIGPLKESLDAVLSLVLSINTRLLRLSRNLISQFSGTHFVKDTLDSTLLRGPWLAVHAGDFLSAFFDRDLGPHAPCS